MTKEEFAAKVDWEGGVADAVDYGLKASDLPADAPAKVRAAWAALEDARVHVDTINEWLWHD